MKSLLVDALRQAKAEQPDRESDESVRLSETPVRGASNDGDEYVEASGDEMFELMQTTTDLVVVDVEVEVEDDRADADADVAGPDADAAFDEAFEASGPASDRDVAAPRGSQPVRHGRPDGLIEHSAQWLPVLCLLLLVAAMGAVPVWRSLTSNEGSLGLTVRETPVPFGAATGDTEAEAESRSNRFPFVSQAESTTRNAAPVPVDPPRQQADIVVQVRERTPVGATELRDDTFSTIAALYAAHLAGEVSRVRLAEILDARVRERQPGTESEIKLLLQQYPDEPVLYNALGTLLAGESRWPEARAAFASAAAAAEGAR